MPKNFIKLATGCQSLQTGNISSELPTSQRTNPTGSRLHSGMHVITLFLLSHGRCGI